MQMAHSFSFLLVFCRFLCFAFLLFVHHTPSLLSHNTRDSLPRETRALSVVNLQLEANARNLQRTAKQPMQISMHYKMLSHTYRFSVHSVHIATIAFGDLVDKASNVRSVNCLFIKSATN